MKGHTKPPATSSEPTTSAMGNPLRQAVHAGLVAHHLFQKPPPHTRWSAIVHDMEGMIRVQVGPSKQLLLQLAALALQTEDADGREAIRRSVQDIQAAPDKIPVFVIDDNGAALVLVSEAELRAFAQPGPPPEPTSPMPEGSRG